VTSSLLQSVAYMEATANELFEDANDPNFPASAQPLAESALSAMAAWWRATDNGRRSDILLNYQMLLVFNGRALLKEGEQPYQQAKLLVELRNALVHFRPESVSLGVEVRLEKKLKRLFPPNPLWGSLWWPHGCLGSGCALWGFVTADGLVKRVLGDIGIPLRHLPHPELQSASDREGK